MFIDIHVHVTSHPGITSKESNQTYATPEQLIEMYDEVGVTKAVLLPTVNPEGTHCIQSNEEILRVTECYPDRFIPFCNIDPRLQSNDSKADLSYTISYYRERGCRGIGEVCANLSFNDPRVENLFDHAEKCQMPLCFHVATREGSTYGLIDELGLPRFEQQIQKHLDLVFLCHSQAFWSHISSDVTEETWGAYPRGPVISDGRVTELFRSYPNVYGDLSAGSGYNAVSRDPEFGYAFMEEFQDRLCFGTDICSPSNRDDMLINLKNFMQEGLNQGYLSQEAFDKIAYKNASRLLEL